MTDGATSRIEVDTGALRRNAMSLQEEMHPATVVAVVKSNAYGHGYHTVLPAFSAAGIQDFAVFSTQEASHAMRYAPPGTRMQVMGHARPEELTWLATSGIAVWANDLADVDDFVSADHGAPLQVHLEVETGMYRTGVEPRDAVAAARLIADSPHTELVGLCTHLAGAEDPGNDSRIATQAQRFEQVREELAAHGLRPPCHISSSSAALRWPERRYDMVRCGIATYGLWPTPAVRKVVKEKGSALSLTPALSWHSWIMACKDVPAGACVGYGESFCTAEPARLGIIPVGYGDGFSRLLSMKGHVLVRGRKCPIVGQVNMNMVLVLLPDASMRAGDRVVLMGRQGVEEIHVHSFSEWNEVVNYEFMARLGWHVPRVAVDPETSEMHLPGTGGERQHPEFPSPIPEEPSAPTSAVPRT